jgi:hypothetical protein
VFDLPRIFSELEALAWSSSDLVQIIPTFIIQLHNMQCGTGFCNLRRQQAFSTCVESKLFQTELTPSFFNFFIAIFLHINKIVNMLSGSDV